MTCAQCGNGGPTTVCSRCGLNMRAKGQTWCRPCCTEYQRQSRRAKGVPEGRGGWWPPVEERIAANLERRGDCLWWTASVDSNGYPQVWMNGKNRRVHRILYEWEHGPIPEGLELDHLHERRCVNHVELVTHQENIRRAFQ